MTNQNFKINLVIPESRPVSLFRLKLEILPVTLATENTNMYNSCWLNIMHDQRIPE